MQRLAATLREGRHLPAAGLIQETVRNTQAFSGLSTPPDDFTLVIIQRETFRSLLKKWSIFDPPQQARKSGKTGATQPVGARHAWKTQTATQLSLTPSAYRIAFRPIRSMAAWAA